MINLVDMKLPKKTKEELKKECLPCASNDQEQWPYGLKLSFEKEQVDKIPSLKSLNVGDKVLVQGEGSVVEVRMSERQGGEDRHSVEIQIEKVSVGLAVKKPMEKMSPKEYRMEREGK